LITRAMRGLEDAVTMTVVDPHMARTAGCCARKTPIRSATRKQLRDVYLRADPRYSGRVTVPVLWDRERGTIVNNESREVMRMLDVDFAPLSRDAAIDTLRAGRAASRNRSRARRDLRSDQQRVYRAGFAKTQAAYEAAVRGLFAALTHWNQILADRPFTCAIE